VAEVRAKLAPGTPIEVWFQDEMRVGQKNKLTYRWARKGSRPPAVHDQRTQSTYLFGAVCPEHGTGAALVLPFCNTEAMQLHLDEIATKVTAGAHAILILDQAGWHGDDIVDHCCYAWNTLIDQPWKIMSIARRDWAAVGHSL
jgi:DDE superfamily endonuclease